MEVEIFTIAKQAQDNNNFLTIVDTIDTVTSPHFPVIYPGQLVGRLRWAESEQGQHQFNIRLVNSNNNELANLAGQIDVGTPTEIGHVLTNFVIPLNNTSFPAPGKYTFLMDIDGVWRTSVPLLLRFDGSRLTLLATSLH